MQGRVAALWRRVARLRESLLPATDVPALCLRVECESRSVAGETAPLLGGMAVERDGRAFVEIVFGAPPAACRRRR